VRNGTDTSDRCVDHFRMNINALVIEDERADVVVIRQALAITSAGSSHVEYVASLAEGVERLARGGIDVVLLDLSLPDSEGSATLRALRSAAPQVPLLVVARAGREAGDDDESLSDVTQFILRDRLDCHRLADVVRSVIKREPFAERCRPRAQVRVMDTPPSTSSATPVMKLDASDAR
jgi:DNA-binding NarL/FixJ family response regulator